MAPRSRLRCFLITAILATPTLRVESAQLTKPGGSFTVEEAVKLSQAGFSEELIITKIKKNGKAFDLSTEELLELKNVGVSENVIKFLLDPSQPYQPAPAPPEASTDASPASPTIPAKQYPEDDFASRVPVEPGLYRFVDDAQIQIDVKLLMAAKEGAGLGKLFLKKGKAIAYLVGAAAKTRVQGPVATFYLRLPEGKGIEEVMLVAFERKSSRREIEVGPGPNLELKAEVVRQFDALEVGPRLFRITTSHLAKGEYLLFLVGSAEPQKGTQGRGYDFGIDVPK